MHKERWYKDTERIIRQYFLAKDRITGWRKQESAILENIEDLKKEMSEVKGIPKLTAKYGAFPGGTSTQDSDFSQLMVQYNEQLLKLQKLMLKKYSELYALQGRITESEEQLTPLDHIMDSLSDDEYMVLEQRYLYRRNNCAIAKVVHCTEGGVRYRLKNVTSTVAEKMGMRGGASFHSDTAAIM